MSETSNPNWQHTFEMFKLEYEQAAQRYENIYRAIWQIFQYMALLSAGILTFGFKDSRFPNEIIVFIALSPLVFWFLATYIPMDRYGQDTRKHLKCIEKKINEEQEKFFLDSNLDSNVYWEIKHFTNFVPNPQEISPSSPQEISPSLKHGWRVRHAVLVFGTTISTAWIFFLLLICQKYKIYQDLFWLAFVVIDILLCCVILCADIENDAKNK